MSLFKILSFQLVSMCAPVFTPDYKGGVAEVKPHAAAIQKVCSHYQTDPKLALTIVFPEVMRYSQFKDFFETQALELGYISGGKTLADFSIGLFQMKPSFVEQLETRVREYPELATTYARIFPADNLTAEDARAERLRRLKLLPCQTEYVCAFLAVMNMAHPQLKEKTTADQIRFLAAAYNLGINASAEAIENWAPVKNYPYGTQGGSHQIAYADVSLTFFETWLPKIF